MSVPAYEKENYKAQNLESLELADVTRKGSMGSNLQKMASLVNKDY